MMSPTLLMKAIARSIGAESEREMVRKLKNFRWSFAEHRRLLKLAASSKSIEEIANLMNRSPEAIRKVAIRLGVSLLNATRRSIPTERLRAVGESASASAGGRLKAKGK
jgi:hypothetical protein